MRLWQQYVVRNALRWLEIEGRTIGYKKIDAFMQINVKRFGEHDTLVALGQLATKSFITHWAPLLYVHVSALKKYVKEIPVALRAHHKDIVSLQKIDHNFELFTKLKTNLKFYKTRATNTSGRGFFEKVKTIGETTYALSGWVWETRLQKSIKESASVRDVNIMHRGGLFMGGLGALGKPGL